MSSFTAGSQVTRNASTLRVSVRRLGSFLLWCFCLAGAAGAQSSDGGAAGPPGAGTRVTVEVQRLKVTKGRILVSLHRGPETFPRKADQALRHEWVRVTGDPTVHVFDGVPPGEYAVGAAHDENDNGKIDTGVFGIPVESLGVSNDPFSLGPPSFESAKFKVGAAPVRLVIRLR